MIDTVSYSYKNQNENLSLFLIILGFYTHFERLFFKEMNEKEGE